MERKEIIFFTGVRRSGKRVSIHYLIQTLLKTESKENILYLSMDYTALAFSTLELIYKIYNELFPDKHGKIYIFLDEIQNIENWELWVRNIQYRYRPCKFFRLSIF